MYEVIAKPREPLEQAQQVERRENHAQGPFTPVLSSRLKASPGACPIILNYDIYICIYYLCIIFQELFGTLVALSLGFLELY